jgi:hypothetical protein
MKAAETFISSLPAKPFCSDDLKYGLSIRSRDVAVKKSLIQPNTPFAVKWLVFDIDRDDAYFAYEDRDLPVPSFIAVNNRNGHCHYGYMLRAPILKYENSIGTPIRFLEDVRRGMTRKLGADHNYTGLICKNPLNSMWCVEWNIGRPYELAELNDCLDKQDKKPFKSAGLPDDESVAIGRNKTVFDVVRQLAYRECRKFHSIVNGRDAYLDWLFSCATEANADFSEGLPLQELHGICKSIFKWTWEKYTPSSFSQLQRQRVLRRWHNTGYYPELVVPSESFEQSKPWLKEGVSRRTWYRNKKKL